MALHFTNSQWFAALNRQRLILKTQFRWWQKKRYRTEAYLLLGLAQSGKSSLLKATNATAILDKDTELHSWQQDTRLHIEINADDFNNDLLSPSGHLDHFLTRLQLKRFIKGYVICLDYQRFYDLSEQQQQLETLQQTLALLKTWFGPHKKLLFILTKADLITGFNEFFADFSHQQRQKSWGLDFLTQNSQQFDHAFKLFLQTIQANVMTRLQHSFDIGARELIVDFPLQIESLKQTLYQHLKSLTPPKQQQIQCYFTSSTQHGDTNDRLHLPLQQDFAITPFKRKAATHYVKKIFFVQNCFNASFSNYFNPHHLGALHKFWLNRTLLIIAPLCLVFAGLFWLNRLHHDLQAVQQLQHELNLFLVKLQAPHDPKTQLSQTLSLLDELDKTLHSDYIQDNSHLKSQAQLTYFAALRQQLVPQLVKLLHNDLGNKAIEPVYLYQTLRAYLMLGDKTHRNAPQFLLWLDEHLKLAKHMSTPTKLSLTEHSRHLFEQTFGEQSLDQDLIASSRKQLTVTQGELLALFILQSEALTPAASPFNDAFFTRFFDTGATKIIPGPYVPQHLPDILHTLLPKAVHAALVGNWVTGQLEKNKLTQKRLEPKVQQLMLTDYMLWWDAYIARLKPKPLHSIAEIKHLLTTLAKDKKLRQIIQSLQNNIHLPTEQGLPHPLLPLYRLIDNSDESAVLLSSLEQQLHLSAKTIQTMISGQHPTLAAFKLAKARAQGKTTVLSHLSQLARRTPAPLGQWLTVWSNNAWQQILHLGQQHIDKAWQAQIIPFYQHHLFARYPLFQNTKQDISLEHFSKFFSPNGLLVKFFGNYIQPFVRTDTTHWKNRRLDKAHMNFSDKALENFTRANIIKKMFFGKQSKIHVNFSLQAVAVYPELQAVALHYQHRKLTDLPDSSSLHHLHWPGKIPGAQLSLVKQSNPSLFSSKGEWGLLKLLGSGALKAEDKPNEFLLTFQSGVDFVTYKVHAANLINPFMPGIIDNFRCPLSLSGRT